MPEENHSAVVLLSGGIDSSVLLHHVVREIAAKPVHAVSFDYGQRHVRELDCARWQAAAVSVAVHRVIDASVFRELVKAGSTLIRGGAPVPDLKDLDAKQLSQPPTYVPNRNMILLSIAAAYAEAHEIHNVYYGAQAQDEYGYWDCTSEFIGRLNAVLALNRAKPVTIHAPFVAVKKAEIVKMGLRLGVSFAHTWSCYRGADEACGTCPTCTERLHAFEAAGTKDPLPYLSRA